MSTKTTSKISLLILTSLFFLGTKVQPEKSIEKEAQLLFNGIPVQDGIIEIIKASGYEFSYGKTTYLLGASENWIAQVEKFDYLDSSAKRMELELSQSSQEKALGCYNASIRLFYTEEALMKEEFFRIKKEFERLGEKIDTETIQSEDYDWKSQLVIVYFDKDRPRPNLSFSFDEKANKLGYQIFINYQNCLASQNGEE